MKKILFILFAIVCSSVSGAVLDISGGYVRATPPGLAMSSAFMVLTNNSAETIVLTGAQSPLVKSIEIHNHAMVNGMMSMKHIKALVIKPGEQQVLQSGSLNFMLIGVKQALIPGNKIPFVITFKNGEKQALTLPIKSIVDHVH